MKLILDKNLKDGNGDNLNLSLGQFVNINFIENECVKEFSVKINNIEPIGDELEVTLDNPKEFFITRRRNYFRLDTNNFKKKLKDSEEHRATVMDIGLKIKSFARTISDVENYKTELVNISAGGILCFFTGHTPPLTSLLEIRLLLPGIGVIEAMGRVARIEKSEKNYSSFFVGVTFVRIKEEDREKIIEFTYNSKKILEKVDELK